MTVVLADPQPQPRAAVPPAYAGLVTRTLAFALDVAIIDVVALVTGAIVALGLSALDIPDKVMTVLTVAGAAITVLWSIGYLAWFWSASGQTPGDRVLGLRVLRASTGEPISFGRAVVRVFALLLSALPFCFGFVMILFDDRRRALHDRIVHTVVVYHDSKSPLA
jgi:uncharacterized RDD family membrane protein YckC